MTKRSGKSLERPVSLLESAVAAQGNQGGEQAVPWSQARIEQLIADGVEESLTLDYKAAAALAKTPSKREEITKDVSAFANSAGGTVIYGVKEFQARDRRHLPEKIDPIQREEFSKEWVEHVIQNIRPRIEGLAVRPVDIAEATGGAVYVVEIPAGSTAHQAQDFRYYRRYNFESVPMSDHEIRDVMNRSRHPKIEVSLMLIDSESLHLVLALFYKNVGRMYARYVNGFISVSTELLDRGLSSEEALGEIEGQECEEYSFANIHKDVVEERPLRSRFLADRDLSQKFYVTRYDPILPGLERFFFVDLNIRGSDLDQHKDCIVHWSLFADNAPKREETCRLVDIPLSSESKELSDH